MASVISGYEYDIFISYRQKDNKHDGWVTEFVRQLKGELESTCKEGISVYFDTNPHDGLLETHDVVDSLKEKLKCLIFIPIISRTYCDPKSFAWVHEFKAFIKQASNDQFGLKVKLRSGNVASRILPVRIHELDTGDALLLEKELGGIVRAVEFVYKSSGVNRPLRSNEEHPDDNVNHILYRDQVNKVANAIKELLGSMIPSKRTDFQKLTHSTRPVAEKKPVESHKASRTLIILGSILIILFAGIWGAKSLIYRHALPNSIIVLPFATQDSVQNYFAEGMTADVITELAKVKNITTLSWNTSDVYSDSNKSLKEIAGETGVSYIITGIIQRENQNVRVNVALVSPKSGKSLWTRSWDNELIHVFDIQKQIASDVARELGVKLSSAEKARLDKYPIRNFEAYDLFLQARKESRKFMSWGSEYLFKSNQLLDEALAIFPDFPQALTLRANNNIDITQHEGLDPLKQAAKIKDDLYRSLSLDPDYSDTYIVFGILNWWLEWNFKEAKINLDKGWELSYFGDAPITQCFCGIIEFNMATGDFLRAADLLSHVENIDPNYPYLISEKMFIYSFMKDTANLNNLLKEITGPKYAIAQIYYELGEYEKVIQMLGEIPIESKNPWGFSLSALLASAFYKIGMIDKSDHIINQLIKLSGTKRNIDFSLAAAYAARGDNANAVRWYKSAYLKHDIGITTTLFNSDLRLITHEPEVRNILREIGMLKPSVE